MVEDQIRRQRRKNWMDKETIKVERTNQIKTLFFDIFWLFLAF